MDIYWPKHWVFQLFGRGMGNFDMYWPKHWVFLLFGRGWGTWICIDPNIELSKFPIPIGSNWKTQCLGLCISKFPTSYRTIEKVKPWVNADGELGYVVTQTLSFSIFRYGMGNLDMHRPKHLVFLLLGTGWGTWICIANNRKTKSLGQYISKFPTPLPKKRKTQCVGQYISKFPIPHRTIEKLNVWVNA
jgi:hypothetical protein